MSFAAAEKIADAVLYEGYLLYPYRPSALKNQLRWQFGVLMPRGYAESNGEFSEMQSECLLEATNATHIDVRVRFLTLEERLVEEPSDHTNVTMACGREKPSTEGIAQQHDLAHIELRALLQAPHEYLIDIPGARGFERNGGHKRVVRQNYRVIAAVRIAAQSLGSFVKLTVRVENLTDWPTDITADRNVALRQALIATHIMIAVHGGGFLSLIDPPDGARAAAASCANLHCWPVLIGAKGTRDLILAAPIMLEDYPQIAPESPVNMFDGTEIDEVLTLRTLTLTDAEKAEAKASDARAAALIEHVDAMTAETFQQLHGAVRSSGKTDNAATDESPPWWTPEADASVAPETDSTEVNGITIAKGSVVRLQPSRHADAQDMFLVGRWATVHALFRDVDGRIHVAVTLSDDPASELHQWYGRYYYFAPDELEPLMQESPAEPEQAKEKPL